MGSGESVGGVHVNTASVNFQPGDTVTGTLHLQVTQTTNATAVVLLLKATERTELPADGGGKQQMDTSHRGKKRLLRQRFEVYRCPQGALTIGQFDFPFSVRLPTDLKPSIEYRPKPVPLLGDGRKLAAISYKLVGKVENCAGEVTRSEIPLQITSPVAVDSPCSVESSAHISTWCFCRQGAVRVKATFEKTVFTLGELANVAVHVDNEGCRLPVTGLQVELRRALRIRAGDSQVRLYKRFVNSVSVKDYIPPKKATLTVRPVQIKVEDSVDDENAWTARGDLVECMFTMAVLVEVDGVFTCHSEPAEVTQAVSILPRQIEKPSLPVAPGLWSPTGMQNRDFSVGPEFECDVAEGNRLLAAGSLSSK